MPNWNSNTLTLTHKFPSMIQRAAEALEADRFLQEFIPIPDPENSYDFCCTEWGTKWDVQDACIVSKEENSLIACFDTAWSPPIEAYQKLEEMGFEITAYYYEGGCSFCGKYENGVDNYYNIEGDSTWVEENIPKDIDEEMAISENMSYNEELE